jgi:hypothetical protein
VNWVAQVRFKTVQVTFVVIDHEFLSTVIRTVTYLCSGKYRSNQLTMKEIITGKLFDSMSRLDAVAELW